MMRCTTFPAAAVALAAISLLPLHGCAPRGNGPQVPAPPGSVAAFAPVSLRIHPLTHVDAAAGIKDATAADKTRIVLHFELKDRFGDNVKALGTLRVELLKPGSGATPGIESRELTWDVAEFADPDENFKRFDTPTRTYRVLLNAPRWVGDSLADRNHRDAPGWVKLRARFEPIGQQGLMFIDEYVLQP
ncbi:MAG: hypothetical protein KF864_04440 [Phycisphaeraceae bacterium]|nr:hypothetical protein [Phycisphaeraceae bacterium]